MGSYACLQLAYHFVSPLFMLHWNVFWYSNSIYLKFLGGLISFQETLPLAGSMKVPSFGFNGVRKSSVLGSCHRTSQFDLGQDLQTLPGRFFRAVDRHHQPDPFRRRPVEAPVGVLGWPASPATRNHLEPQGNIFCSLLPCCAH